MNETEMKIRELIGQNIETTVPVGDIKGTDDLFQTGMDSISCIKLIVAIEAGFGFEFDDEDLNMDNMRTIGEIVKYVEGKMQDAGS